MNEIPYISKYHPALPFGTSDVQTKLLYGVVVNSDLTEGKGQNIVIYLCETVWTAKRMAKGQDVQGTDGSIHCIPAYKFKDMPFWYGPMTGVIPPSKEDRIAAEQHELTIRRIRATEKAKELGLTEQDIRDLLG